ncbi:MAG: hypothetical protein WC453_00620 [Patescibacteria group bacterium]
MATMIQNLKYITHPRNHKFWQEINKSRVALGLFKIYKTEQEFIKDNIIYSPAELKKITGATFVFKNNKMVISLEHKNGIVDLVSAQKVKISLAELKKEASRVINKFSNKLNSDEQTVSAIIDCILFDGIKDKVKKLLDITLHYVGDASRRKLFFKVYKNSGLNKFKDCWRRNKKQIEHFKSLVGKGRIKVVKKDDHVEISIYSNTSRQNIIDIWTKEVTPLLHELPGYQVKNRPLKDSDYQKNLNVENTYVNKNNIDKSQPYKMSQYDSLFEKVDKNKRKKLLKHLK